jgi:hypothetical protein
VTTVLPLYVSDGRARVLEYRFSEGPGFESCCDPEVKKGNTIINIITLIIMTFCIMTLSITKMCHTAKPHTIMLF